MLTSLNKYLKPTICLLLFVSAFSVNFGQEYLKYGITPLKELTIDIDNKYKCHITPSFYIRKATPDDIQLTFSIDWYDKKDHKVPAQGKFSLIIKINNNLNDYCKYPKICSAKSLNSSCTDLPNSIRFEPYGVLEILPLKDIFCGSFPIHLTIRDYINSYITLNLELYVGKDKTKSLEIEKQLPKLSWKFKLPVKEKPMSHNGQGDLDDAPDESEVDYGSLSCEELYQKFNSSFKKNQPQFQIGYFEGKLDEIQFSGSSIEDLAFIQISLLKFQSDVYKLKSLQNKIKGNPKYNNCNELRSLNMTIDQYIPDLDRIETNINKIQDIILSVGSSGGGGSGAKGNSYDLFKLNLNSVIEKCNMLDNLQTNPELSDNYEKKYFDTMYIELLRLKKQQDSLYKNIQLTDQGGKVKEEYKKFNDHYNLAILIISELSPSSLEVSENEVDQANNNGGDISLNSKGGKFNFPYWILIPVVVLLLGFGVYRYMAILKKGKKIKK